MTDRSKPRRSGPLLVACALAVLAVMLPGPAAPTPAQGGGFELQFVPADDPALEEIRIALQEEGDYEGLVGQINDAIALPETVLISFQPGDGPLFDPSQLAIVMSYEFAQLVAEIFAESDPGISEQELWVATVDTLDFVLFHEIGHALIEVLELPVVGREEDAVDSLAAVLATELLGDPELSLGAALTFERLGSRSDTIADEEFWGEHSLDLQRYSAIVCWAFGADPEGLGYLIDEKWMPAERAEGCVADYERQAAGWLGLLGDAVRD